MAVRGAYLLLSSLFHYEWTYEYRYRQKQRITNFKHCFVFFWESAASILSVRRFNHRHSSAHVC
jgi:hypothetical protein